MSRPKVSVIIPTFNRRELVVKAIDCVLAQTFPVEDIVVVDDGSTDGTAEALAQAYGDRIRLVRQANAGVSAARNRGLEMARGEFISLLDSDDLWLPEKTERQVGFLEAHPGFGMVLCDIMQVDRDGHDIAPIHRRDFIPEDGPVLKWVLRQPALAPLSAMFRREVYETVGGFDVALRTAEDIDFHLRVARRWPIGVVSEELVRAMRGHDGLSALERTYADYQLVVERFAAQCRGEVPDDDLDAGLAFAYLRNARGLVFHRRWGAAFGLSARAVRLSPSPAVARLALSVALLATRRFAAVALGRAGAPGA